MLYATVRARTDELLCDATTIHHRSVQTDYICGAIEKHWRVTLRRSVCGASLWCHKVILWCRKVINSIWVFESPSHVNAQNHLNFRVDIWMLCLLIPFRRFRSPYESCNWQSRRLSQLQEITLYLRIFLNRWHLIEINFLRI